jgi:uncharacterized protein
MVGLLFLSAVPTAAQDSEGDRGVSVYIGKSPRRVNLFGWAVPKAPRARIVVKVWKETTESRTLFDSKKIEGRRTEMPPYGSRRGTFYSTWLDRPRSGECLATVRIGSRPRSEKAFPCSTPAFGDGTATLTGNETRVIDILVADEGTEWQYGLMYRKKLPADEGMAFVFPDERTGGFWMANTLIPLSIAFVDGNDQVVDILDMDPCWQEPCRSYAPADPYVTAVEVNQGAFARWGIAPGDTIHVSPGS